MNYTNTKSGNLLLTFESPINLDNGFTNNPLGTFTSTMELFKNDEGIPEMIEWDIEELETTESIGLWFDGNDLCDYDGVFELPKEAIELIKQSGFNVSDDFTS